MSTDTMTNNMPISIDVDTQFIDKQSSPEHSQYAFAYTITISNHSTEAVKLISRHWLITDSQNKVQEVRGDGVIGQQPLIQPGSSFSYTSGALLETSAGTMEGSYQMISESGLKFDAPIQLFSLIHPGSLH